MCRLRKATPFKTVVQIGHAPKRSFDLGYESII
jgi:hypothetical protein